MNPRDTRGLLDVLGLGGVLAVTLALRLGGLATLHDRGDQLIWAGLARNAAARGLEGYTVRGIDTRLQVVPGRRDVALWRAELAPILSGGQGSGSLVEGLVASGEKYWDAPLANQPPAYTAVLVASHALLGHRDDGWPLVGRAPSYADGHPGSAPDEERLARDLARERPRSLVQAQAWATFPPLASDLVTVALLWGAGVAFLRSRRAALVVGLAYATDPLALFAAHRVLSNATLATATLGAILAWARAGRLEGPRRTRGLVLAGLLAGLATLVKLPAVFLVPAVLATRTLERRKLPDAGSWLVAAVALAVNAPWWWLSWRLLGNPLGMPWQKLAHWTEESRWGELVTSRGLAHYPLVLAHSPAVVLGALGAAWVLARALAQRQAARDRLVLAAAAFGLLVLGAAQLHSGGKEGRHILLAYPAFLVVAGAFVEPARRALARALGDSPRRADLVLALLLAGLALVQAWQGLAWAHATASVPP